MKKLKSRCRLAWISKHTKYQGHGEWVPINKRDLLEEICEYQNNLHPMTVHWVEEEVAEL